MNTETNDEIFKQHLLAARLAAIKQKPFVTRHEVAILCGISHSKLDSLIRSGKGPAFFRMGGTWHISQNAALEWFESHQQK